MDAKKKIRCGDTIKSNGIGGQLHRMRGSGKASEEITLELGPV